MINKLNKLVNDLREIEEKYSYFEYNSSKQDLLQDKIIDYLIENKIEWERWDSERIDISIDNGYLSVVTYGSGYRDGDWNFEITEMFYTKYF